MATAKKNPEGCGSVKIGGCSKRVCRCLLLTANSGVACPNNEIVKTIELTKSDPANELFEWTTSFALECSVLVPPVQCLSRTHDFKLQCDHGDWKAFLNNTQMFENSVNCNPVLMDFEIHNPKDCVATGLGVTITEIPD